MPPKPNKKLQAWIARHAGKHLCQCGCGQPVQPDKNRFYRGGRDWFVQGHQGRGKHHPGYKGGRMLAKGYVWILSHDHPRRSPRNYVKRCWLVVERHLGRYLTEDELVHHDNGVKTDDRLENLIVKTQSQHTKDHCPRWRHDIDFHRDIEPLLGQGLTQQVVADALGCSRNLICRRRRWALLVEESTDDSDQPRRSQSLQESAG